MLVTVDAERITSSIIACSFGTTAPVLARVSSGAVECVSPAKDAGAVRFLDATVNLIDYTSSEVMFRYGHRSAGGGFVARIRFGHRRHGDRCIHGVGQ